MCEIESKVKVTITVVDTTVEKWETLKGDMAALGITVESTTITREFEVSP